MKKAEACCGMEVLVLPQTGDDTSSKTHHGKKETQACKRKGTMYYTYRIQKVPFHGMFGENRVFLCQEVLRAESPGEEKTSCLKKRAILLKGSEN